MTSSTTNLIVGFLQDLLVTGGSIITGAMLATETVTLPPWPVVVLAILTGMIQAARRAQSKVDPSVVTRSVRQPEVKLRTPDQLAAEGKAKEEAAQRVLELAAEEARVAAMVTRILAATPKRVAAPVPEVPPLAVVPKDDFS